MAILMPMQTQQPMQKPADTNKRQNTIRLPMQEHDAHAALSLLKLFERRKDVTSLHLGNLVHLTRTFSKDSNDREEINATITNFGSVLHLETFLESLSHILVDSLTIRCWPWAKNLSVVFQQDHCRIRHLDLEECPALSDEQFQGLCNGLQSYQHLESLSLRLRVGTKELPDASGCTLPPALCPQSLLKKLRIMFYGSPSPLTTGSLLNSILSDHTLLQELELVGSDLTLPIQDHELLEFTNCHETMQHTLGHHTTLKELMLENWKNPLLRTMMEALKDNSSLETLDLRNCQRLSHQTNSKMTLSESFNLESSGLLDHVGQVPAQHLLLPDSINWADKSLYNALKNNQSVINMGNSSSSLPSGLWRYQQSAIPSILAQNGQRSLPQPLWSKWMEKHHQSPTALMAFLQSADASVFIAT